MATVSNLHCILTRFGAEIVCDVIIPNTNDMYKQCAVYNIYSAISSSRPLAYLHSFPISPKSLHSLQIPSRGADIGGMRTSGANGFGAAAPARIAATTTFAAEHLPKVIRRQVYYRSKSSCQVPIYTDLF